MERLLRNKYCDCGSKIKESIIERMFFYEDGKFSWTAFGALNGYVMLWTLFIDYYFYGRAEEVVLSWSLGIIGLMIGIRPAQKGLESLTRGIGNATSKGKFQKGDRVVDDVPVREETKPIKIVRPTDPRGIEGRWVLKADGSYLTLEEWQKEYGVSGDNVGKYFTTRENKWNYPNWVVAEDLIRLLDRAREIYGKSMTVTSLYRPGNDDSAHGFGLATDVSVNRLASIGVDKQGKPVKPIDTKDMDVKVKVLRQAAKELNIDIRITWTYYLNNNLACVHVDIAPMYFRTGKPFADMKMDARRKASFALIGENIW